MIALTLVAAGIIAAIGIGYLVLGRNRYGEMGSRSRKRLTAALRARAAQAF